MINRLITAIRKVKLVYKAIKHYIHEGGYTQINISQINRGEILKGKRILITGGGSGIGLSIAKKCLSEGAIVVITGRNEKKLEQVHDEIKSTSFKYLKWDITDIRLINEKLIEVSNLLEGDVDILVNNAGVLSTDIFPNVTEEIWDQVYSTNSKGLFFLTQSLCKDWLNKKNRNKKIINISSAGGFTGATYPYRMTKWDIVGLTQGLGRKLAPFGIIVNGIAPGRIATDMQGCKNPQENIFDNASFVERYGLSEEVAELAVFLMSDSTNFIIGQTIICDGGGYKQNS